MSLSPRSIWRSIFLLNVPFVLASIGITRSIVNETVQRPKQPLDIGGQLSAIIALAALTFALIEGATMGWANPTILAAFFIAVATTISFILFEARGKSAILPLMLFRNTSFSVGMVAGIAVNFALSGLLFILTLYFQQARGYSALITGLAFLPLTVPTALNPIFTGRLVGRIGTKAPTVLGFLRP